MSGNTSLASRSIGEGLPVLVIPGWTIDGNAEAHDFEPVFAERSGFRRIYVNLPGMGSTPAGTVQNLDDMYMRLVDFIDSTLSTSKFLVVGTSCGAYFARAISHKYRDQVEGLLLRVPLVEPETTKRDLDPFAPLVSNAQAVAALTPADREALGDLLIETPDYIAALKVKSEMYQRSSQLSDHAVLTRIRDDPALYRLSHLASETIAAPTLILCGRQDPVVGYRDAMKLLEHYPRATFAVLDRGTHALPVTEQNVFKTLVNDWLDRVQEWKAANASR